MFELETNFEEPRAGNPHAGICEGSTSLQQRGEVVLLYDRSGHGGQISFNVILSVFKRKLLL